MTLPSNNIFGDKKVQIVRHVGDLNSAYLPEDGTTVHRQKSVVIPAFESTPAQNIPCMPYDGHFVYRHVYMKKGKQIRGWTLWCTCGSPSGIIGYSAYKDVLSDGGQMIACLHYSGYGKHMDGSS